VQAEAEASALARCSRKALIEGHINAMWCPRMVAMVIANIQRRQPD
jgi:hypothetical protein